MGSNPSGGMEINMCECHDSEEQHEVWHKEALANWKAFFGGEEAIKHQLDVDKFYMNNPDPED